MFDKDLFLSICEKYDVEFSQTADSPILREVRTMKREIIVETNDDFKSCDDCVHSDDTTVICKMRGCTHAIMDYDIKECYQPKGITISKSMFNACLDSMAKFEKIKKIVNTPFCEREE